MSSITSINGCSPASRSITPSTSSSNWAFPASLIGVTLGARPGESSGNNRPSSSRAGPKSGSSSSGPISRINARNASTTGASASPAPPNSMQPPVSTRAPASRARAAVSSTSRVLPTPASPPTITTAGSATIADSSAVTKVANSGPRPTKTGLAKPPTAIRLRILSGRPDFRKVRFQRSGPCARTTSGGGRCAGGGADWRQGGRAG